MPDIITNRHAADAPDLEASQQPQGPAASSARTRESHGDGGDRLVSFRELVPAMLASSGTSTDSQAAAAAAESSTRTPSSMGHLTHRQSSLFASGVPTIDDVMSKCQQPKVQPAPTLLLTESMYVPSLESKGMHH